MKRYLLPHTLIEVIVMKTCPGRRLAAVVLLVGLFLQAAPSVGQIIASASAGPNFTSLDIDTEKLRQIDEGLGEIDYDPVVGFYLGFTTGFELGPFVLRTGLTFVNAGAIFDGSTFLDEDEFKVNFITLPVDLRFYFPVSERVQPYVSAGPEFRYRLRLDVEEADEDFINALDRLTPTASIGAGVSIELPVLGIGVSPELRYAVDFHGLVSGEVTLGEEAVRIREAFKADMYRLGVAIDF